MNIAQTARILGGLVALLGLFQLLPMALAWWKGEAVLHFAASAIVGLLFGGMLAFTIRPDERVLRTRDGFVIVVVGWGLASVLGALPYFLSGSLSLADALFESAAGFTTTGATVMSGLDSQPRSLLLWRAMTQWLGGMGIIVFAIAVLPLLGVGGMQLFRTEAPGPVAEKIAPRMAETARRLWLIYLGFTALEFGLLVLAGMSPFESLCHSFTTASTGGFSTRDDSLRAFDSAAIEWIVIVFMVVGGINYVVHFELLTGRIRQALRDAELRYYLGMLAAATLLLTALLAREPVEDGGLRGAAFQAVATMTGTGYHSALFDEWPPGAQMVLLVLMLLGGMAGSTTGGVKGLRVLLSMRVLSDALAQLVHPHAVQRVKHDEMPVPAEVLSSVWGFLTAYGLLVALTALVVSAEGFDLVTSVSVGVSAVGNVGPALGDAGPIDGYAAFNDATKLLLAGVMIAGRLEVLAVLVLFHPSFRR